MDESEIKKAIVLAANAAFDLANQKLGRAYPYPSCRFDLRGTTAGKAYTGANVIRFNIQLALKNTEMFLKRTPAHESAHLIANNFFGRNCGHDEYWKHIMVKILGVDPSRCHSYDVSGCRARRVNVHIYSCGCPNPIRVGTAHHNLIQTRPCAVISCRRCGSRITKEMYQRTVDKYATA